MNFQPLIDAAAFWIMADATIRVISPIIGTFVGLGILGIMGWGVKTFLLTPRRR